MAGIGDRIVYARQEAGFKTTTEFARRVDTLLRKWGHKGISRAAIVQWETGDTKNLRPENLVAVAEVTGFAAKWLAVGLGPKQEAAAKLQAAEQAAEYGSKLKRETIELARSIEDLPAPSRKIILQFVRAQKADVDS